MRSKAPLVLMEQMVMVLVFALAAALCIRVFVLSDQTSRRNEIRAQALTVAQNAAETLKYYEGDYEAAAGALGGSRSGDGWGFSCSESWETAADADGAAYHVRLTPTDSPHELMGSAEITVCTADGDQLCALPVAWQEVSG